MNQDIIRGKLKKKSGIRKILLYGQFLGIFLIAFLRGFMPVQADQLCGTVVQTELLYKEASGEEVVLKRGNGFLFGDQGEKAVYCVAPTNSVSLSSGEYEAWKASLPTETSAPVLEIWLNFPDKVKIRAEMVNSPEGMNLTILRLETVSEHMSLFRFPTQNRIAEEGSRFSFVALKNASFSDASASRIEGTITGWTSAEGLHYYDTNFPELADDLAGCPALDEEGSVLGICTGLSMPDGQPLLLMIGDFVKTLEILGIPYSTFDQSLLKDLQVEVGRSEEYLQENYTEESWNQYQGKLKEARNILKKAESEDRNSATEESLRTIQDELSTARKKLTYSGVSLRRVRFVGVVAAGVGLLVTGGFIWILISTHKTSRKHLTEQESARKKLEAELRTQRHRESQDSFRGMPPNRSLEYMQKKSGAGRKEMAETAVLDSRIPGSLMLIQKQTGERVVIHQEDFIIGSDPERTDYAITNRKGVSRTHVRIRKTGNGWSLQDLNSTNGTFLNHRKIEAGKEYCLQEGQNIRIANEEFSVCHI